MSVDRNRLRAVIVAGAGANYGSLQQACRRIGVDAAVSSDHATIRAATHVLLPGVGAAGHAMQSLRGLGLDRVLTALSQPLLGICLGMQLLFESSQESPTATETVGLGLLPDRIARLPSSPTWPHMGWNRMTLQQAEHPLLAGISAQDWFYFVHGYAAPLGGQTLASCEHGVPFSAIVARGSLCGVQFHPEKSAQAGRRLLSNFFGFL